MSSLTKYYAYGPKATLKRMAPKLLDALDPKYLYTYQGDNGDDIHVALFEQYEKQINATISLLCVIESGTKRNRIELKKSGGRMGFRGSSLSEEKKIESDVVDFVMDYCKRFGLSLQEEVEQQDEKEEETT